MVNEAIQLFCKEYEQERNFPFIISVGTIHTACDPARIWKKNLEASLNHHGMKQMKRTAFWWHMLGFSLVLFCELAFL